MTPHPQPEMFDIPRVEPSPAEKEPCCVDLGYRLEADRWRHIAWDTERKLVWVTWLFAQLCMAVEIAGEEQGLERVA